MLCLAFRNWHKISQRRLLPASRQQRLIPHMGKAECCKLAVRCNRKDAVMLLYPSHGLQWKSRRRPCEAQRGQTKSIGRLVCGARGGFLRGRNTLQYHLFRPLKRFWFFYRVKEHLTNPYYNKVAASLQILKTAPTLKARTHCNPLYCWN